MNLSAAVPGKNPAEINRKILEKAKGKSFEELKKSHISDYKNLFERVKFKLKSDDFSKFTTPERLKNYASNNDFNLNTLLFQYGRYLMISGSRPGGQPLNLQGIWNAEVIPPWNSGYTININTEMNYWPAESANLMECAEPLHTLLYDGPVHPGGEALVLPLLLHGRGFHVQDALRRPHQGTRRHEPGQLVDGVKRLLHQRLWLDVGAEAPAVRENRANVLLGPTLLGRVAPYYYQLFFPKIGHAPIAIRAVTTLGVVLFLRTAGIEVDLSKLWRQGKSAARCFAARKPAA